ncbi:MAG: hypothetical protein ACI9MC_002558 [Kiritimatiellia bacterium]|jgi:hypothetical protein
MSVPQLERVQPGQSVWGLPHVPAWCEGCSRGWMVPSSQQGALCGCGAAKLQASSVAVPVGGPEGLVAAKVERVDLPDRIEEYFKGVKWRDKDVKPAALAQRAVQVWWPRYLVDSGVVGTFQVEVGFDYEAQSSIERYAGNSWVTEKRVEWRIRWEARVGKLRRRYDNITVSAVRDQDDLPGGDSQHSELSAFDPVAVNEQRLQVPDLSPTESWGEAEPSFRRMAGEDVQRAVQGQHVRDVHVSADFPDQHWTLMLQPMWMTWYKTDSGEVLPIVIDAVDGEVVGSVLAGYTWAWIWGGLLAVSGATLLFLSLVGAVLCLFFPPAIAIPIVFFVFGVIILGLSVAPFLSVRWWNLRQRALAKQLRRQT